MQVPCALPYLSCPFCSLSFCCSWNSSHFRIKEMKVRRKRIEHETLVLNLISRYIFPDATKAIEADINMKKDSCGYIGWMWPILKHQKEKGEVGWGRGLGSRTLDADFAEVEWVWLHLFGVSAIYFICCKLHIAVDVLKLQPDQNLPKWGQKSSLQGFMLGNEREETKCLYKVIEIGKQKLNVPCFLPPSDQSCIWQPGLGCHGSRAGPSTPSLPPFRSLSQQQPAWPFKNVNGITSLPCLKCC